jgi:hypothetical protein
MTRLDNASDGRTVFAHADDAVNDHGGWFDVAVLVENEVTGTSARRMTELYQMKSAPLRYHLVRPLGDAPTHANGNRQEAERLMHKSVERMEALQALVTGVVSDQEPIGALLEVVNTTQSREVVVVTGRHRLATLLHRDLASQVRSLVDLPITHLVER